MQAEETERLFTDQLLPAAFCLPVLQIFREDFYTAGLHDVVMDGRRDFKFGHGLVYSLPESLCFFRGFSQIEVCYQLAKFLEHYRVQVLVVVIYNLFLMTAYFPGQKSHLQI